MNKILPVLLLVALIFNSSCSIRLGKSKFRLKQGDKKCEGKSIRVSENAIEPKHLKTIYYKVDENGDSVQVEYDNSDFDNSMRRAMLGYEDLIPLTTWKGKPFTGKSIFMYYDDDENSPMPGCYKTISTYKNGLPLFTDMYYPNGQLKSRLKGINLASGSSLKIKYDYNGQILDYTCNQPGFNFSLERNQKVTEFNKMGILGFQMQLIDTSMAYKETYVIDRVVRYDLGRNNETFKYEIESNESERIIYENYFDSSGAIEQTQFSVNFYDYFTSVGPSRSFTYPRKLYDPDTVLRLHIEYLDYGGIKTLGQYFMNKRHGIWNYYNDDGSLKDVELYEGGRKHYSLHDENGYIYFHALYDTVNGELLQYKNDWVPNVNPDSSFVFDFNVFKWCRHQRKDHIFLEFWSFDPSIANYSQQINDLMESFYRKEFHSNGKIKSIGFVTEKEEKTGIWIEFSPEGDTVIISDKYYGEDNGLYRKYINGALVEKRDEIPEVRKGDLSFYRTTNQLFGPPVRRREYWFRTKTW